MSLASHIVKFLSLVAVWCSCSYAQAWKQIYPSYETDDYTAITVAGHDTVYITGMNFLLQRSTDGGVNWETLYHTLGAMDIVGCGYDGTVFFMMPGGKAYYDDMGRDSTRTILLTFDPVKGDTASLPVPMSDANNFPPELSVAKSAIFLSQYNEHMYRLSRSVDHGRTWSRMDLPDSLLLSDMCFSDSLHGLLACSSRFDNSHTVYSTRDGGRTLKRHAVLRFDPLQQAFFGHPMTWIDDTSAVVVPGDNIPYITRDGGETWTCTNAVVPAKIGSIRIAPTGTGYWCGWDFEIFKTTDFGFTWNRVRGPSTRYNYHTMAMQDDSGVVVISNAGNRISTTDGGTTWNNDRINPFTEVTSLMFFNSNDGFMEAMLADRSTDRYRAWTSDGGRTWQPFDCPNPNLLQFIHTSRDVAYAVPGSSTPVGTIVMKTTDRGTSWTDCLRDTLSGFSDKKVGAITNMSRGDDTVYVAFRNTGSLVWTTNGGISWNLHAIPRFSMMNMSHQRYSWGITDSLVMRSSDDGMTWEPMLTLPSDAVAFRKLIAFSGESVAIFSRRVNAEPYDTTGYVHRSTDGGRTWFSSGIFRIDEILQANQSIPFLTAAGVGCYINNASIKQWGTGMYTYSTRDYWQSNSTGYILGTTAYMHRDFQLNRDEMWLGLHGRIYATTNGGIDWIERAPPAARGVTLEQNHPNPVRSGSTTTIGFTVSGDLPLPVAIDVFDLLGRPVGRKFSSLMNAGRHSVTWDSAGLPPGLYVIRLATGTATTTRKMLVR